MKKVLIVGNCGAGTKAAELLADMPTGYEVIEDMMTAEQFNNSHIGVYEPDPLMLTKIDRSYEFFPRAKHEPKGHERKYKYHK